MKLICDELGIDFEKIIVKKMMQPTFKSDSTIYTYQSNEINPFSGGNKTRNSKRKNELVTGMQVGSRLREGGIERGWD